MYLYSYDTGYLLRPATRDQIVSSLAAARVDGGAGVILVDTGGHVLRSDDLDADEAMRCYVAP